MEDLFKKFPFMIGLCIGGFLIAAWITGSFLFGLVGAGLGATAGAFLDGQ